MEIWEGLMCVVLTVVSQIHQPMVDGVIQRTVDAICGFVSGELGRLWRLIARQKKPQVAPVLLDQGASGMPTFMLIFCLIDYLTKDVEFRVVLMCMQSKIIGEGWIHKGPWGGNGGAYWTYKVDVAPILQITLGWGSVVDSILIKSKSCDGNVIGNFQRIGGPGGHNFVTVRP
ncbi:hypothetical protein RHSIM_Rhsim12G0019000 [Rhododendron simsii]|uniref:Jacalin-type lectin domain-containing protein n=1 Tax=Rhododendron simsii TaxID=118357 RepID=A0A834G375_RHOSS|nr:hypothetical protein RHSIM_Rhsim12G0019000 [Rhododendron simsii]